MRISDWSSDVCSSDLAGNPPKEWIDSGYMLRADSIEELAEKCGIPVATLRATIKRFNGFATSGVDADFHRGESAYDRWQGEPTVRPNPNLRAIEQPPFSAVRLYRSDERRVGKDCVRTCSSRRSPYP